MEFNFHSVLFRHWEGAAVVVRKGVPQVGHAAAIFIFPASHQQPALIMMVIDYERGTRARGDERAFGGRQG